MWGAGFGGDFLAVISRPAGVVWGVGLAEEFLPLASLVSSGHLEFFFDSSGFSYQESNLSFIPGTGGVVWGAGLEEQFLALIRKKGGVVWLAGFQVGSSASASLVSSEHLG